jgi:2-polyprenyl-6-methoxyphenol hydroxylase-like FAD-dependent oxidoreductase
MAVPHLNISILGGGPSGLYLAMLVKRRNPNMRVTVYEQNKADDTFGFGVVLADTGLNKLEEADAASAEDMRVAMHFSSQQTIRLNDQSLDIKRPGTGGGAITRIELLKLLQKNCQEEGVELRFSSRVDFSDPKMAAELDKADLVVGADGIHSVLRKHMANEFGTSERYLKNRFAWFGTRKLFANPALIFRQHAGGHFVAHYYRYSDTMSTFVAECDEKTWFECGLDTMSETDRKALIEKIFSAELEGEQLISSNSIWRQFPVIRNKHWSYGKYVLMGDALASAHFSIGSGTRIAMEDAIALANALTGEHETVTQMLAQYEAVRRPSKLKLIEASENSFNWYELIAEKMAVGNVYAFAYDFMTRTGRIDAERLAQQFPELLEMVKKMKAKVPA